MAPPTPQPPARQVPFRPIHIEDDKQLPGLVALNGTYHGCNADWKPVLTCEVEFGSNYFSSAMSDIIHHPEFNSTIILRADILTDTDSPAPSALPVLFPSFRHTKYIRRKILPRRPERDASLEQDCIFFSGESDGGTLVVLVPAVTDEDSLPFYHPKVRAIAFHHLNAPEHENASLAIHIFPFAGDESHVDPTSRLSRICSSLAESVWRIGFGKRIGYQKKMRHDVGPASDGFLGQVVIDRNEYQDFYLVMRERYKAIVESWSLDTDPLKHVFEDIGIATFIQLLWKHTCSPREAPLNSDLSEPWQTWGRPPCGYVDPGCGNGLLVHILVYIDGIGIDLRPRTTWDQYPEATKSRLHIHAYDPTEIESAETLPPFLNRDSFLIGNHSDELTPWLPILAVLSNSAFISIPCCPWTLNTKFTKPKGFHKREKSPAEVNFKCLLEARGSGGSKFEPETEALRIPSSRNWAIIGRRRVKMDEPPKEAFKSAALATISEVRDKGLFKTRPPEVKGYGH
ncbi:tRNA(Ser) Um(44) 2'-O-methyltransferase [Tulasnella sp. 403]|nr:tRNA(Ser) Um(44) 2'-O-methyltransferase [Tulasnella sp. 403]